MTKSTKNYEVVEKKKNYIDKQEFFTQILISIKEGQATDRLCRMFQTLCDKYVNSHNFVRYCHIRDDLISEAVLACYNAHHKFEPLRGDTKWDREDTTIEYNYKVTNNPFAYFTTCAHNAILQFLKKEYNQVNIKNEMRVEEGLGASYGYEEMMSCKPSDDSAETSHPSEGEDD